jgi:hypothetical protein
LKNLTEDWIKEHNNYTKLITLKYPTIIQTKKINKGASEFNCTIDQMGLTDVYTTFQPTARKYILLSSP